MRRESHVRFCERLAVKPRRPTHHFRIPERYDRNGVAATLPPSQTRLRFPVAIPPFCISAWYLLPIRVSKDGGKRSLPDFL